jgi:hypothetical protein
VSFWIRDMKQTVSNAAQMQHLHIQTSRFTYGRRASHHILKGSSPQSRCCPCTRPLLDRELVS